MLQLPMDILDAMVTLSPGKKQTYQIDLDLKQIIKGE